MPFTLYPILQGLFNQDLFMHTFFKQLVFSLFLLNPFIDCNGKEPTKETISSLYDGLVIQGKNLNLPKQPLVKVKSSSSAFSLYPFVLWDYAEDIQTANPSSAVTHWNNLLGFISENTITRVITNIKNPKDFSFFSVDGEGSSFISYANKLPSSCELAVLFDLSSFVWDLDPSPTPNPGALPSPYGALPSYFLDLPLKMEWVKQMIALGVPIKEVVLDPQPIKDKKPANEANADYQLLIDFMDYFCTLNNLDVHLGLTYGVNVKEPTFSNLSSFPTPSNLAPPGNFPPLTAGLTAPEWRADSTEPLLDHVYIQVYESGMPYIFTLQDNPTLAATSLLHNFRDEPYLLGSPGTITFSTDSKNVTGTNTTFTKGSSPITEDMPIGVLESGNMVLVGLVSETVPITDTTFSVNSNPPISGSNLPFYQTEIINKWIFPFIAPAVTNNIYLMFSFENQANNKDPFFGTWDTDQFIEFLTSFYTQGQTTLPIYMEDGSTSIPMPNNFAIYDFNIFSENVKD